jgi:hypothetical protein
MKRSIILGAMGLFALAAFFLLKRVGPQSATRNDDLQRWEDDGGRSPEVDTRSDQPFVTVDIHSA